MFDKIKHQTEASFVSFSISIEQGKISVLHVRHGFCNIPASYSAKQQLEITHFYFFDSDFQKTALWLYFSVFTSTVYQSYRASPTLHNLNKMG